MSEVSLYCHRIRDNRRIGRASFFLVVQGYLVHKKTPTPQDHQRVLGIDLR